MILFNFNADVGPYPITGPAPTFSGGGAGATAMGRNGLRVMRAAGVPRLEWRFINGVWRRTWLLEGEQTNILTVSEPTKAQALTTAGVVNVETPAHGFDRFLRVQPGTGATEEVSVSHGNISAQSGTVYTLSIFVEMLDSLGAPVLAQTGDTNSDFRIQMQGSHLGFTISSHHITGNLYRIIGTRTLTTATGQWTGIVRFAANRQRDFRVTGYQMALGVGSSYIKTVGTAVTRAAESLSFAPSWTSQAISQYERFINHATGALVENVTTGIAPTLLSQPQIGRSYLNLLAATGTRDVAWFRANLA